MQFPQGGMDVTPNDLGTLLLGDNLQRPEIFEPPAADTLYPAGTVLGRVTVSGDLRPYVSGAGDGSQVPIAVLPFDVQSDSGPADVQIEAVWSGKVNLAALVRNEGGSFTKGELDELRNVGIIPISSDEQQFADNT